MGVLKWKIGILSVLIIVAAAANGAYEIDRQCTSTGSVCVDSCTGLPNGYYQWCGRCDFYVQCLSGTDYHHPCQPDLVYDHALQRCGPTSNTCSCNSGSPCSSDSCYNGGSCEEDSEGGVTCVCSPGWTGTACESLITCSNLSSRPYPIMIQQQVGHTSIFEKTWSEMLVEQGSITSDYWIGLTELSELLIAGQGRFKLHVYLTSTAGYNYGAEYTTFKIGSASNNFTLEIGGYSGTVPNALGYHNGTQFSTIDRDNDQSTGANVAQLLGGAFWHRHESQCWACVTGSPSNNFIWNYGVTYYLQKATMTLSCME